MCSPSKSDIYFQGVACLNDPKMSREVIESLVYERKVKIDVPGFPNKTLTIKPADKQFRKNLKAFAKDHKNHIISELEKNYLMKAFLCEIRDAKAIYRTTKKSEKRADLIFHGVDCIKDPNNRDSIVQSLIAEKKVRLRVPGFSDKILTIKPLDKHFRKELKELKNQPLSSSETEQLITNLLSEIKNGKASCKLQKAGKQKKKHSIDPETQKRISAQASIALEEVSNQIMLLENKKESASAAQTETATKAPFERVAIKDQERIITPSESKTTSLFEGKRQRLRERGENAKELRDTEEIHSKERKRHEKEMATLEKHDSILRSELTKQTARLKR